MSNLSSVLAAGIVYGPVRSRRLGLSLGVNILPANVKVCSFNCNYCQCGWTTELTNEETLASYSWPDADTVGEAVRTKLTELRSRGEKLDCVTISGNGEPTLHPDFERVVASILLARNEAWPGVAVDILSNGANLDRPGVADGLNSLDERYMKLDAGTDEQFLNMNSPTTDVGVWDVMQGFKELNDFVVQAMFTQGRRDNTDAKSVQDWMNAVRRVKPKAVHLFSIDRPPADPQIRKVPREQLVEIKELLEAQTGISAYVF